MNTADKQTSNLSSDFHYSNSANFSERKFARDYDKDPLVITDYSNFIDFTLCGVSFFCAMSLFLFAINYFDDLIYFYCEKIYDEVGEYFLQKDIDIDEIEKSYSFE